jgi:hypothetical protein
MHLWAQVGVFLESTSVLGVGGHTGYPVKVRSGITTVQVGESILESSSHYQTVANLSQPAGTQVVGSIRAAVSINCWPGLGINVYLGPGEQVRVRQGLNPEGAPRSRRGLSIQLTGC